MQAVNPKKKCAHTFNETGARLKANVRTLQSKRADIF